MTVSFDRAVEYYDATRGYPGDTAYRIRDSILAYTKATKQTRFLELGVGTGRIALPFIQAGYNYNGIDISQAMMDKLHQKIAVEPQAATDTYTLTQGDITTLPYPDASFDVIIAVHVFHLIPAWQKAIEEAKRVLQVPGSLLISGFDNNERPNTPQQAEGVRSKWEAIVKELGGEQYIRRANDWRGVHITDYLKSLGATIEQVDLLSYQVESPTPRAMYERLAARMYSGQWTVPDDIFNESISRLKQWLETEHPNPDEAVNFEGQFSATIARF